MANESITNIVNLYLYKSLVCFYLKCMTLLIEKKFTGDNKPIWQVAEEREENKHLHKENTPYGEYGGWHKAAKVNR